MTRAELNKGMTVTYIPDSHKHRVPFGNSKDYEDREVGKITSWNDAYIFVDYDNSGRGKATRIENLIKGDHSFYCPDEWNSSLDSSFGRCSQKCYNCSK